MYVIVLVVVDCAGFHCVPLLEFDPILVLLVVFPAMPFTLAAIFRTLTIVVNGREREIVVWKCEYEFE